ETLMVDEPNIGQMNTLRINKILKKLEDAIAKGSHAEAASIAKELAQMRLDCRVIKNPKKKVNGVYQTVPISSTTPVKEKIMTNKPSGLPTGHVGLEQANKISGNVSDNVNKLIDANSSTQNLQMAQGIKSDNTDSWKMSSTTQMPGNIQVISQPNPSEKGFAAKSSPTTLRETGIDLARREVKSDPITLLGDEFPSLMKEEAEQTPFDVSLYVEDKNSHQGPITLSVTSNLTLGDLREK
ncbi:unnamed protein product, partial [Meganyctiphanes norvegica]